MLADVTIIMPTFQGKDWLIDTLHVIYKQIFDGKFELIAIDSSSTDGTPELLQDYGAKIVTIKQSEFTHGYARNLGVSLANSQFVIMMSQDVLPVGDDWLARMVRLLDDPQIGAAHVQQLSRSDATPLERFFHERLYPDQSKTYTLDSDEPITLDKLFYSNVCSITYRDLCLRFPFPENVIMSEDQAFARELLKAGYKTLYSSDVKVIHSHHYDLATLFKRNFDSAYSLLDITEDTILTSSAAGIKYIADEVSYLIRNQEWAWLPFVLPYEATRIAGRILGAKAEYIPLPLRRRLSLHHTFWSREAVM